MTVVNMTRLTIISSMSFYLQTETTKLGDPTTSKKVGLRHRDVRTERNALELALSWLRHSPDTHITASHTRKEAQGRQ